jgi:D-alanine transaminase
MAYLNGRFMPLSRAMVSVEDRGFQFGDGVYELIRAYGGRLFCAEAHLERLARSAAAIGLKPVYSRTRWIGILKEALKRSGFQDAKIYIQLTRGAAPREHAFPRPSRPTVVVTVRKLTPMPAANRRRGVSVITVPDIRWGRCDIKTINLLPNVMAREKAIAAGAYEAIFVRDGWVTEGSGSNVFALIKGAIVTPPKGPMILPGITREEVLHLAKEAGLHTTERPVKLTELMTADEVFLTATTAEVLPVIKIDDRPIGGGRPGEVARLLHRRFQESIYRG